MHENSQKIKRSTKNVCYSLYPYSRLLLLIDLLGQTHSEPTCQKLKSYTVDVEGTSEEKDIHVDSIDSRIYDLSLQFVLQLGRME